MKLTINNENTKIIYFLLFVIIFRFTPTNFLGESLGMRLGDLICYVTIVILLFFTLSKKDNLIITTPLIFLILMSLSDQISLIISLYNGVVVLNDAFELTRMIIYILIYLVSFNYFKISKNKIGQIDFKIIQIIMIFIYAITFIEIYYDNSILNFLSNLYSFEKSRGISAYSIRTVSMFANPNYYGIFLSVVFNIFYYLLLISKTKKNTFILSLNLLVITLCVFSTGSRTAFLVLIFGFLYNNLYLFILKKITRKKIIFIILTLSVLVFYFIGNSTTKYQMEGPSIFSRVLDIQNTSESLNERFEIWDRNNKDLKDSIIFGNGPNKSEVRVFDNNYLFILYRNGIVGLVIFVTFLLIEFFKSQINLIRKKNINESIVYSNIILMMSVSLYSTSLFFNLQTGLLLMIIIGWYSALTRGEQYEN